MDQVSRASCNDCRARKRKCDGQQTCSNCVRRGIGCVYEAQKKCGKPLGQRRKIQREDVTPQSGQRELSQSDDHDHACEQCHGLDSLQPAAASPSSSLASPQPAKESKTASINDILAGVSPHLAPGYRRYIWSFFTGPGACLPLVTEEMFAASARITFSRTADGSQTTKPRDYSACLSHEGGCCRANHQVGGCCRSSQSSPSPSCPCFQTAQCGLVWSIIALGAHISGECEQAAAFVATSRRELMRSLFCAGEVTSQAFFILAQYHYGLGDTDVAFKFIKKAMDIVRTLDSPSPAARTTSEFFCLLLHIPESPTSSLPLSIGDQELAEFEGLISPDVASLHLPTREKAQHACLKLLAEAAGHLASLVRQRRSMDLTRPVFSLVTRNIDLCRQIHATWQPFGPMNPLMEVVNDAVRLWAVGYMEKLTHHDHLQGGSGSGGSGDRGELRQSPHTLADQSANHFLSFLQALPHDTSQSPALRVHSSDCSDDASKALTLTAGKQREEIAALCRKVSNSLSQNVRSGFLPTFCLSMLYNSCFLMVEWGLWDELVLLDGFFRKMGSLWPAVTQPNDRIRRALASSSTTSADLPPTPPQTRREMPTTSQPDQPLIEEDFAATFWSSSDAGMNVGNFLRDLGMSSPITQTNPFDFWS